MDPFIGEIRMFCGKSAPTGWLMCNGQTLQISDYDTLFALLGTKFGGDGTTVFRLPDLRGRVPIGQGTGEGLTARTIGQTLGAETVAAQAANTSHTHGLMACASPSNTSSPSGKILAQSTGTVNLYRTDSAATVALRNGSVDEAGQSAAHNNMMPSLGVNYIIAYAGIFPNRG